MSMSDSTTTILSNVTEHLKKKKTFKKGFISCHIRLRTPPLTSGRGLPRPCRTGPCLLPGLSLAPHARVSCHHAALNETHGLRPGGWLQTQEGVGPRPRTCLSVTAPGARCRARSTARARLVFSTSGPSHVPLPRGKQSPCLLASLGPAHPEHDVTSSGKAPLALQ